MGMNNRILGTAINFMLFCIILLVTGCNSNRVYEQNWDLESRFWHQDDLPEFTFRIDDTTSTYNLYYNLRNTASYPYYNIYITHFLADSTDQILSTELDELILFDEKTGEPYGNGLGDIFDHQQPALENFKFPQVGPYTFKIQQFMRLDSLPYIMSVGLRVERTTPL